MDNLNLSMLEQKEKELTDFQRELLDREAELNARERVLDSRDSTLQGAQMAVDYLFKAVNMKQPETKETAAEAQSEPQEDGPMVVIQDQRPGGTEKFYHGLAVGVLLETLMIVVAFLIQSGAA